jgi:ABC-type branched-subunit amino acid transport system ATPase component
MSLDEICDIPEPAGAARARMRLSGGEQILNRQILRTGARVLLLDEISEGWRMIVRRSRR